MSKELIERLRDLAPGLENDGYDESAAAEREAADALEAAERKLEIALEAFKKIAEFGDYEMADGDAARDVAHEALAQLGES